LSTIIETDTQTDKGHK